MASNKHRLEKLQSEHPESSFGNTLPKIQRVQSNLWERNAKYYTPRLVSIGPIHHGAYNQQQGEKYKSTWAAMYLKSQETIEQLFQKIVADLPTLKGLYTEDSIKYHKDEDLAWIFFLDGRAVLYLMEKMRAGTGPKELMIKDGQWIIVQHDLLLLENQLPFRVLKLLSYHNEPMLFEAIYKFFTMFGMIPDGVQGKEINTTSSPNPTKHEEVQILVDQPTHLLHILYNKYKNEKNSNDKQIQVEIRGVKTFYTHRNIQELKASGIQVKKNKKNAKRLDINFETSYYFKGRLYLSEFFEGSLMAPFLFNMTAFEMCSDFTNNYEISSYVIFMDSLIDNVDDVKDLRKAGVLSSALGSDEEVATLFNTISIDLVGNAELYQYVRKKIEDHYTSKHKTMMAQVWHTYFSNPWSFFAFLATLTALILTFIQTFAVYPSPSA